MSKPKYYFRNEDDEMCYTKKYWVPILKDEGLKEIEMYEAKLLKDEQYFFCKAVLECGEKGNCGKGCEDYEPCNGKNGRCRHMGKLYEATDKILIKVR